MIIRLHWASGLSSIGASAINICVNDHLYNVKCSSSVSSDGAGSRGQMQAFRNLAIIAIKQDRAVRGGKDIKAHDAFENKGQAFADGDRVDVAGHTPFIPGSKNAALQNLDEPNLGAAKHGGDFRVARTLTRDFYAENRDIVTFFCQENIAEGPFDSRWA